MICLIQHALKTMLVKYKYNLFKIFKINLNTLKTMLVKYKSKCHLLTCSITPL